MGMDLASALSLARHGEGTGQGTVNALGKARNRSVHSLCILRAFTVPSPVLGQLCLGKTRERAQFSRFSQFLGFVPTRLWGNNVKRLQNVDSFDLVIFSNFRNFSTF